MSAPSPHPDLRLLERWRSRELAPSEILAVTRHLATCSACQREMGETLSADAVARGVDLLLAADSEGPEHLTPELLDGWVDGSLDAVTAELVASHLEVCPPCREDAAELAAFARTAVSPAPAASRRTWVAVGGSLAAALVVGWLALRPETSLRPSPPPPSQAPATARPAPPRADLLRDGPLRVDAATAVHGVERRWQAQVEAALRAPELALPSAISGLARGSGGQRGEAGPSPPVHLSEPLSRVLLEDRPRFAWQGPAGWTYHVEVYDARFAPVATSGTLHSPFWVPAEPLRRGELLRWKLTASHGDERVSFPTPPEPPATFRIASTRDAAELRAARATGSHLIAGLTLWRVGMLDEARAELALVARANPAAPFAQRLAASSDREAARLRPATATPQ